MNRTYKTVFNRSLGLWQAVAETARNRGKGSGRSAIAMVALICPLAVQAQTILNGTHTFSSAPIVNYGSDDVYIGDGATGNVTAETGGGFITDSSLTVGENNTGTLTIQNGGTVSNLTSYIGENTGATGTVTVTGAGSSWDTYAQQIGRDGTGILNIENGGKASASLLVHIATYTGSSGTVNVSGSNSVWTIADLLDVGFGGNATLNIQNGGQVSAGYVYLGYGSSATGTLNLYGTSGARGILETVYISSANGIANFNWNGGILRATDNQNNFLQNFSSSEIEIQSGGAFIDSNGFNIGISTALDGVGGLTKQGTGTLTLTGTNTYTGGTTVSAGTLQIGNGGTTGSIVGNVSVDSGATLTFNRSNALTYAGTISGAGTLTKQGTGTLTLTGSSNYSGNMEIYGGTLAIMSGGTVANNSSYVGYTNGANGTVVVDGSSSSWTNSNQLHVGYSGTGALNILNGATVTSTDSYIGIGASGSGTVTVDGNDSTWESSNQLLIGSTGNGTLNISNGGIVRSTSLASIGDGSQGTGTVTIDGSDSSIYTNDLYVGFSGNGTLNVLNGGTAQSVLAQIGANAAGSGTAIVDGIGSSWVGLLDLKIGGSGTGALTIGNGGRVMFAGAGDMTLGEQAGSSGTLNLDGTSSARGLLRTYHVAKGAGSATFNWNGGILRAMDNESDFLRNFAAGDINIQSGGAFIDTQTRTIGVNAPLSGVGGLAKQGTGTLTLTGANAYTGGTVISEGTLALSGTGNLASNGSLSIDTGATFDISTASGARTIGALSGAGNIVLGSNALATNSSSNTIFAGDISGIGGSLNKQGSGTLTLSGINTYSGTTVVNAGTLSIAATGSVASNTIVNNGGTLAGTGSVGTLAMNSGGILAPGNSIGTFTVNGNLTFSSGSIYRVEVDAAGASDKTIVNGNVTLAGNVDVRAGAGNYANNTSYTILTHSGTRAGTFSSVTSNLAFLTPTLSYAANEVELNLARNNVSFASVAETRNQRAAASGVERLGPGMVYTAVSGFSAPQAQAAFDALSGTQHAAASQAALNMSRGFSNALMNRAAIAGSRLQGAAGLRYASLDLSGISSLPGLFGSPHQLGRNLSDAAPSTSPLARLNASGDSVADAGIWFQVIGGKGDIKGDGNGSGSDYSSTGFLAGYDAQLNTDWLMGVAVGYGKTQWDADVPATGNVDSPYAALYGRYSSGPWQVRMNGGYADNRFDTTRTITLGATSPQAHSKHTGKEWNGAVEAEYFLTKAEGWEVRPLAALRYSYLDENGFTESGSPAALKIRARSTQQANLGLGSRFVRSIDDGNGSLEFKALITHLAGDTDAPVTASFVGSTNTFNVDGTPLKRTALVLGAGVSHRIANKTALFADLGYETRGSGQHNAVAAVGVQYRW